MTTYEVQSFAIDLMSEYGLISQGWEFAFDNAKRRLGCCHEEKKLITVSRFYAENNPLSVVANTILHEIAHALVGASHHHDAIWRSKAISIGCTGDRCTNAPVRAPAKYRIICTSCTAAWTAHRLYMRRMENGWHKQCGPRSKGMLKVELLQEAA